MRVPSSFKLCFNYTSQGPLKKWTDHNKFAITENSEAAGLLRGGRKEGRKEEISEVSTFISAAD